MTWNPKPSVDLKNRELRAYLVESYVDFGLFAQEVISRLRAMGVKEPCIFEAVSNACVNQPIVYRVQEFYAQPQKTLTPEQEVRAADLTKKLSAQIGQKAHVEESK
jgi:hypothetical protein